MSRFGRWLLVVAITLACWPAWAVEYERLTTYDGTRLIVVQGEFQSADRVGDFLAAATAHEATHVTFDSPGGNLWSAMEHGRAIRSLGMKTFQHRRFECASACAFAFLGGVERWAVEGAIGVHRSSVDRSSPLSRDVAVDSLQQLTAEVLAYLREMSVDPEFLEISLQYDSSDMRYLYSDEMARLGVTNTPLLLEGTLQPGVKEGIASIDGLFHRFLIDCQGSSELEDYLARLAMHRYSLCPLGPSAGPESSGSPVGFLGSLFAAEPATAQQCPAADQEFDVPPPAGRNWKVAAHQTHAEYSEFQIDIEGRFRGLHVDRLIFYPGIDNGINVRSLAFAESMDSVHSAIGEMVLEAGAYSEALSDGPFPGFTISLHQSAEGTPLLSCDISQ